MSTFGLIVTIVSLICMGGSIMLYYADSHRVRLARFLMFWLYMAIFLELILAIFEFPAVIFDGIIYISMGMENIAKIMIIIVLAIFAFGLFFLIPKIKWKLFLRTTPIKLILCGALIIGLLIYTEAYNGKYSFENEEDYYSVKQMYEKYDEGFWPVKFIETDETEGDGSKRISVYPFDATNANGKQPIVYKVTIFRRFENGDYVLYYYPFTYKTYVDGIAYSMDEYIAPADVSDSDISGSDLSGSDITPTDVEATE